MHDPNNLPPVSAGRPQDPVAESFKMSDHATRKENLRTIRNILDELLRTQKNNRFKWSEGVSVIATLIALIALGISLSQYNLAEKALHGTYLLQLSKDTKEISDTISKMTPNIDKIASKECTEARGDLNYSDVYAQAQFELDKVVDFFDFYYTAYSQYDLITKDTWLGVCAGSGPLLGRNCFYKAEWRKEVAQRGSLSEGLALCGAK